MEKKLLSVIENLRNHNLDNMNGLAFESFGTKITYAQFFELVKEHAKSLTALGVKPGDVVAMCTLATVDAVVLFYALNMIGAVAEVVSPAYFSANCKKYINEAGAKVLVILDRFYSKFKSEIANTSVKQILLVSITEYAKPIYKLLARNKPIKKQDYIDDVMFYKYREFKKLGGNVILPDVEHKEDAPVAICYTSGSTGVPKGVVLTNSSFNNMIEIYDKKNGFGSSRGDRNLVLLPMAHATSLCHCINTPLACGCTNVVQPVYNPKTFMKDIKKHRPNIAVGTVAHYISLLENDLEDGAFSFLKMPFCGGEPLPEELAIKINKELRRLGVKQEVIIGYGMSEFAAMVMFNMDIPGSTNESGLLMPGIKAKIVHPITGEIVGTNEMGIIKINSPCAMKEYFKMPEQTAQFFEYDSNGEKWGNTGDIATVDENGVYRVLGRANDSFVNNKGKLVYLFEIENVIAKVDNVKACEVVAVTINGNKVPVAHIIPYQNTNENLLLKNIEQQCREKLPEYSVPYAYKIREDFPISTISSKRDFEALKYETDGFKMFVSDGYVEEITICSEESYKMVQFNQMKK